MTKGGRFCVSRSIFDNRSREFGVLSHNKGQPRSEHGITTPQAFTRHKAPDAKISDNSLKRGPGRDVREGKRKSNVIQRDSWIQEDPIAVDLYCPFLPLPYSANARLPASAARLIFPCSSTNCCSPSSSITMAKISRVAIVVLLCLVVLAAAWSKEGELSPSQAQTRRKLTSRQTMKSSDSVTKSPSTKATTRPSTRSSASSPQQAKTKSTKPTAKDPV